MDASFSSVSQRRFARVLGYARVSSVEQSLGTSLDDQQRAMSAYADSLGTKVARFFVESESGIHEKIERREQMKALLAGTKAGDLVLCDKVDRWSRDPEFTYRTMRELGAKDVAVYFVGDACDPATAEGDTMLNFRVLFAKEEHKRIRQRLVGTRKLLRDRGLYVEGTPPWGYRRQTGAERSKRNELVIEPAEADQVKRVFKLCVAGKSIGAIAEDLGVKVDRVFDALHRRMYLGEIQDGGKPPKWIRGKHPPIVDARTFQAAQDALVARTNGSRSDRDAGAETANWWLRDVAVCGLCGAKMSAAYAGAKGEDRRYYFRCLKRCGGKYLPVWSAEGASDPLVWGRLNELRDELSKPPAPVKARAVADLRERRAKLEKRREKYIELHVDGVLTRDEMRARLAKLDIERIRLDALEVVPEPQSPAERVEVLRLAGRIARQWMTLPPRLRRVVVGRLAVSIGLAVGRDPKPVWRDASELDLSEIGDLLVHNVPADRAEREALEQAVQRLLGKLRAKPA